MKFNVMAWDSGKWNLLPDFLILETIFLKKDTEKRYLSPPLSFPEKLHGSEESWNRRWSNGKVSNREPPGPKATR